MSWIMAENLEQRTRRSFLERGLKTVGTAALAGFMLLAGAKCSPPDGPDPPPPPPTKYKHSIKVEVGKTLHYGQPVTGGTFRATMENTGTVYPPISQDAATLGTTLTLAETTTREEPCTIIIYPKVNFDSDCLTREYRTIGVTNNTLRAENVIKLEDVDWTYLHNNVLTKKDAYGHSLNISWEPRFLNGSSNPDGATGLWLDQIFIEGYWEGGKEYGIKPAILDFQEWSKKYVGTAFEEAYITSFNFNNQGNYVYDGTQPPDGEFRAFRKSDTSGVTSITYPTTEIKVMSSIERVNQSSATPVAAYREALKALKAGNLIGVDPNKLRTCAPVMAWRPKGGVGSTYEYWIDGVVKESQKGVDSLSTTIQNFAQEYVYLEGASSYYNNVKFGVGSRIDYTPGVPHWTSDHPLREAVESRAVKERGKTGRY